MNAVKNQQLASEITQFCLEHLKKPDPISKSGKPLLRTLIIALLAAPLSSISVEPEKKILW